MLGVLTGSEADVTLALAPAEAGVAHGSRPVEDAAMLTPAVTAILTREVLGGNRLGFGDLGGTEDGSGDEGDDESSEEEPERFHEGHLLDVG